MAGQLSRRDFLSLIAAGGAGTVVTGCMVNPVTGERQFSLLTRRDEVALDRQHAPHQISADFGVVSDSGLNSYVGALGAEIAASSHRPGMPYSFQVVNANYINAYAFPGGTVAITRGIMLAMEDEATLSALIGHEVGHVAARHAAQRVSKQMVAALAVEGAAVAVTAVDDRPGLTALVKTIGGFGTGALLARYSRGNEWEADGLGMEYTARIGQNPAGMVSLHRMLVEQNRRKPNALELMFATHPMSEKRLATAERRMTERFVSDGSRRRNRERYQANIAALRRLQPAIDLQQAGQAAMDRERYAEAVGHFQKALRAAPQDYAGLVLMARCQYGMGKHRDAVGFADRARRASPREPQALQVAGIARMALGQHDQALSHFTAYDRALPGNPNTTFLEGLALDKMGRREEAAQKYERFTRQVRQGRQSNYASSRLTEWGLKK